jgi:hypothetical protein
MFQGENMLKVAFRKTVSEKVLGFNIAHDGLFIFLIWWEGFVSWKKRA